MRFNILFTVTVLTIALLPAAEAQDKSSGASPSHAYGDTEFRLGPEDVIDVWVYQEKDVSGTVPVRPDGKISLPLIGEMPASGKTATELQKEIATRLKQF